MDVLELWSLQTSAEVAKGMWRGSSIKGISTLRVSAREGSREQLWRADLLSLYSLVEIVLVWF